MNYAHIAKYRNDVAEALKVIALHMAHENLKPIFAKNVGKSRYEPINQAARVFNSSAYKLAKIMALDDAKIEEESIIRLAAEARNEVIAKMHMVQK